MNLEPLFQMQKELDAHIEQQHPREEGEDRLSKRIIALQVELGELANELPEVFKFWSNKKNNKEKALVELVDCLHFVLSIGLEIQFKDYHLIGNYRKTETVAEMFSWLFYEVTNFDKHVKFKNDEWLHIPYSIVFEAFLGLSEMLGFTWSEIVDAYIDKNKMNHERQVNGY